MKAKPIEGEHCHYCGEEVICQYVAEVIVSFNMKATVLVIFIIMKIIRGHGESAKSVVIFLILMHMKQS